MMQLVEQAQVDLDAPVVEYLPEFTLADPRVVDIAVRQILRLTVDFPAAGASIWHRKIRRSNTALRRLQV